MVTYVRRSAKSRFCSTQFSRAEGDHSADEVILYPYVIMLRNSKKGIKQTTLQLMRVTMYAILLISPACLAVWLLDNLSFLGVQAFGGRLQTL